MNPAQPATQPGAQPGARPETPDTSRSAGINAAQEPSSPAHPESRLPTGLGARRSRPRIHRAEYTALARQLTDRDRAIVETVARHRVFTTDQLAAMFFDTAARARVRLVTLYRLRLLDRFQPHRPGWGSQPYHYVLGPAGAVLLAAHDDNPRPAGRRFRSDRAVMLAGTQRLGHLVGVNGVYAALVARSRHDPSARLLDWLTESECAGWTEGIVRPDAYAQWADDGMTLEFFLEYDRGTETLGRLVDKLPGYQHFEAERAASAWVCFIFTSPRRETTARRALAAATVPVATATVTDPWQISDASWRPIRYNGPPIPLAALSRLQKPPEAVERAAADNPRAWRFERRRAGPEANELETS